MVAKVRKPRIYVAPHRTPALLDKAKHNQLSTMERMLATMDYIREFDRMNKFKHVAYEMFGGRVEIK